MWRWGICRMRALRWAELKWLTDILLELWLVGDFLTNSRLCFVMFFPSFQKLVSEEEVPRRKPGDNLAVGGDVLA